MWAAGASAGAGAFAVRAYNNAGVGAAGRAVSALTHLSLEHACVQHKNTRPPLIQRWAHFSTRNVWRVQRFVVQQAISRLFAVKGGGGHACTLPLKRSLITDKASKQVMIVKVGASTNTSFDRQFSCSPRLKVLTRRRKGHTHIIVGAQKVCTYDKDDIKKFNVWLLAKKLSCLDFLSILLKHSSFLVARTPFLHENS